jgi:hypothetical protein
VKKPPTIHGLKNKLRITGSRLELVAESLEELVEELEKMDQKLAAIAVEGIVARINGIRRDLWDAVGNDEEPPAVEPGGKK